jgi:DNA polymerase III epsilon subunit-like protein
MNNGFQKFDSKCITVKQHRMKLLFFDLETTGTNPGKNGIHQISGEIVIDGKTMERFDFKVQPNPKCVIEEQALSVAGIERDRLPYICVGRDFNIFNIK